MSSFGSPCGACKFLRRKCVQGCVFAPYFCHDQGAAHFAAIHKVFGASNASKLLSHLPAPDRCEAALTISYEAQARLQDPIYGCVSHIFALQQQVVNLQAQLASLKAQSSEIRGYSERATQAFLSNPNSINFESSFYNNNINYNQQNMTGDGHSYNFPTCNTVSIDHAQTISGNTDMEDLRSIAYAHLHH